MPAFWVRPKRSPLGESRKRSASSGSAPMGPAACVRIASRSASGASTGVGWLSAGTAVDTRPHATALAARAAAQSSAQGGLHARRAGERDQADDSKREHGEGRLVGVRKVDELRALAASVTASASWSTRSGRRTLTWLPMRTPGSEPTSSDATAPASTLPATRWPAPRPTGSARRVEDVGADDLGRAQREQHEQREPEEHARADGREPHHEAASEPDQHRGDAIAPREDERGVRGLAEPHQVLRHEPGGPITSATPSTRPWSDCAPSP